jgi:hypothetical protein
MDPRTVKVLATVNRKGDPHLSFKQSLRLREDGDLEYDEIVETSITNQNMFYAIWFNKIIVINILTSERRAFKMACKAKRSIVSGQVYLERYREIRDNFIDSDLGAVWIIEPLSYAETTLEKRRTEEEKKHPLLIHLDRVKKIS